MSDKAQYIIGMNGPPKVGKDTVGLCVRHLLDSVTSLSTHVDWLARPMRQMAMGLVGLNPNDFNLYNVEKDKPNQLLRRAIRSSNTQVEANDSLRELMIATSEELIKPRYGYDFWGRKLIYDQKWLGLGYPGILIVPDVGFSQEVDAFDELEGVKTLIVQLERNGVGWANDSRDYCFGKNTERFGNNGTPMDCARQIVTHMTRELGWSFDEVA